MPPILAQVEYGADNQLERKESAAWASSIMQIVRRTEVKIETHQVTVVRISTSQVVSSAWIPDEDRIAENAVICAPRIVDSTTYDRLGLVGSFRHLLSSIAAKIRPNT